MKFIVTLVSLLLLTSCQSPLKTADNLANIAIANDIVMSGQASKVIKSVQLTDTESMIVDHAFNSYAAFAERWKNSITTLDTDAETFAVFLMEFQVVVHQYREVEKITVNKWDQYSVSNKALLADYHNKAKKVYGIVDELVTAGRIHDAMVTGVEMIRVLLGMAALI